MPSGGKSQWALLYELLKRNAKAPRSAPPKVAPLPRAQANPVACRFSITADVLNCRWSDIDRKNSPAPSLKPERLIFSSVSSVVLYYLVAPERSAAAPDHP